MKQRSEVKGQKPKRKTVDGRREGRGQIEEGDVQDVSASEGDGRRMNAE